MLVEIHIIQNHSPANLNRDDLGAPKTAVFGDVPRARISSQCLKRSIRKSPFFTKPLDGHIGIRTRSFPARVQDALKRSDIPRKLHEKILEACTHIAVGDDKGKGADVAPSETDLMTGQLIHLGPDEAELFVKALAELSDDDLNKFIKEPAPKKDTDYSRKLAQAYRRNAVDIALFGRMTTSPAFENVEASMQVAHAISTHEVTLEVDYFTAVDDDPRGRLGAGLVKENQFLSATFYKYFSLDWEGLLENLAGDLELAEETVRAFIDAAARAVPSGKRNSHAHNNLPHLVMVEVKRDAVPTNYANAFLAPARSRTDRDGHHDIASESIRMLGQHVNQIKRMYAIESAIHWCALPGAVEDVQLLGGERLTSLPEVIDATLAALKNHSGEE